MSNSTAQQNNNPLTESRLAKLKTLGAINYNIFVIKDSYVCATVSYPGTNRALTQLTAKFYNSEEEAIHAADCVLLGKAIPPDQFDKKLATIDNRIKYLKIEIAQKVIIIIGIIAIGVFIWNVR